MSGEMNQIIEMLGGLGTKVDNLGKDVDHKINDLGQKLDDLDQKMEGRTNALSKEMDPKFGALEEKITALDRNVDTLEETINGLDQKVYDLNCEVVSTKATLSGEIQSIKITLENETHKNIRIIAEGHTDLNKKLDEALKVESEKEFMLLRVNTMENELRILNERLKKAGIA